MSPKNNGFLALWFVAVFALSAFIGCSSDPAATTSPADEDPAPADFDWNTPTTDGDLEPETEEEVEVEQGHNQTVGADGGVVDYTEAGVELEIPPGALTEDVEISIRRVLVNPAGLVPVSDVFLFEPEGLTFELPITVTMKYNAARVHPDYPINGWWTASDDIELWENHGGNQAGEERWRFQTEHFSMGAIAYPRTPADGDEDETEDPDTCLKAPTEVVFTDAVYQITKDENVLLTNQCATPIKIVGIEFAEGCSSAAGEFQVVTDVGEGLTIEGNQATSIVISYRMADPGADECTLIVNAESESITIPVSTIYRGEDSVTCQVSPNPLTFGALEVGQRVTLPVEFKHPAVPDSNALLELKDFALNETDGVFSIAADSLIQEGGSYYLSSGESLEAGIQFEAAAPGSFTASLAFDSSAECSSPIIIEAECVAPVVELSITADDGSNAVDFGNTPVGETKEAYFSIRNTSTVEATLSSITLLNNPGGEFYFQPIGTGGVTIPPGKSKTINLGFSPNREGVISGLLQLNGDFYPNPTIEVNLTGVGNSPTWTALPHVIDFGAVPVFGELTGSVQVTNSTGQALAIDELNCTYRGAPCETDENQTFSVESRSLPIMLQAGESVSIEVTFHPTDPLALLGNLEIVTNYPYPPNDVADITLMGVGAAPGFSIRRTDNHGMPDNTLHFGQVGVSDEKGIELSIRNMGVVPLVIDNMELVTQGQNDFRIEPTSLEHVAPNQTRTLMVIFTPKSPPGARSADLVFSTNDPENQEFIIHLSGVAINPVIYVTPTTSEADPYDFGSREILVDQSSREFTILNIGNGPLTIMNIQANPDASDGFAVDFDGRLPFDIDNATESTSAFVFDVTFAPTRVGEYAGEVFIYTNDANNERMSVYVAGRGQDCDEGFYTCPGQEECAYRCDFTGVELCDGLDNDCDCEADEDFLLGQPCDGEGECGMGVYECHPENAQYVICSSEPLGSDYPASPPSELCDGLDNDCDGETDETFNIGQACQSQAPGDVDCPNGVIECFSMSVAGCSTSPGGSAYEQQTELCNGIDDDCDGRTDEGFLLDETCRGQGVCAMGVTECSRIDPTQTVCSSMPGGSQDASSSEACNGQDDDCDGQTDEDYMAGSLCEGQGECGAGVVVCRDLRNTTCSTEWPGHPDYQGVAEICDALDNDCDGETDEDFNTGDACVGAGECGAGEIVCKDETSSTCSTSWEEHPDYQGVVERCNGLDDDCDGETDEDFHIGEECEGVGECGQGVYECGDTPTAPAICSTNPEGSEPEDIDEICNGKDDDCDGLTDEDFELGDLCEGQGPCGAGRTECNRYGDFICSTDFGGTQWEGVFERCNGIDDDCNGETDESFGVGDACTGSGSCSGARGQIVCVSEEEATCDVNLADNPAYAGSAERCDGLDNDCDGSIDEDWEIGLVCEGIGACGLGVWQCDGLNGRACSTNPGENDDQSRDERCNGMDDDCDGETDEDFGVGVACNEFASCQGVVECTGIGDETRCSTDPDGTMYDAVARIEQCDGRDNDCDGEIDEDYKLGSPCNGIGQCVNATGFAICDYHDPTKMTAICSTDAEFIKAGVCDGESSPELCVNCDPWIDPAGCIENGGYAGSMERCNSLDDDCDGETDEDFPNLWQSCDVGGECGEGYYECDGWETGVVCSKADGGSQQEEAFEVCNGIDDDCNGTIDDMPDWTAGDTCRGEGVCVESEGVLWCDSGEEAICSVNVPYVLADCNPMFDPHNCIGCDPAKDPIFCVENPVYGGEVELCDGRDNDCDGETDEDFTLGEPCLGKGICGVGIYECGAEGLMVCSTGAGGSEFEGEEETCNGQDDDCDGEIDNGFNVGRQCDGVGECGLGRYECDAEGGSRCSTDFGGTEYVAEAEVCDGLDNDCDGYIDQGLGIWDETAFPAYVPMQCTGTGGCTGQGIMECLDENEAICSTDPGGSMYLPQDELCNFIDDDCDGYTDENWSQLGMACEGVGQCSDGLWECSKDRDGVVCSVSSDGSEFGGQPELCDGLDNDCDGLTDEDYGVGNDFPCQGQGECGWGYMECASLDTVRCDVDFGGSNYPNNPEQCDELDNDCDGQTDEGFKIGEICRAVGECRLGEYECDGLDGYRCSTNPGGSQDDSEEEICDGKDNDCDGVTDEDFDVGQACTAPNPCGAGVYECDTDTTLRCSTAPGGSDHPDPAPVELCNGRDDDCDRLIDEDFFIYDEGVKLRVGDACQPPGTCPAGTVECHEELGATCSTGVHGSLYAAGQEECDGLDDDCDGLTDEDFELGQPCQGVGLCGQGVIECTRAGVEVCSSDIEGSNYKGVDELCDGQDNDCDGETDEDFLEGPNGDGSCYGEGACGDNQGVLECASSTKARCTTDFGGSLYAGSPELCDGIDNDCDGLTDEDFGDDGVYNAETGLPNSCQGTGACGIGVWECINTVEAICSADPGGSDFGQQTPEVCNELDDDCDGETDEIFDIGEDCVGLGRCMSKSGVMVCKDEQSSTCSVNLPNDPDYLGMSESCNGIDDDCDGETDEGFELGEPCNGQGVCGLGSYECGDDGEVRCSTDLGGTEHPFDPPAVEECNGKDDDCDGQIDEDFSVGDPCDGEGACGEGLIECANLTSTRCSTEKNGSQYGLTCDAGISSCGVSESCNGIDDDCDGAIDEDYGIGDACFANGTCGEGVKECDGEDNWKCSSSDTGSDPQSDQEICDLQDNDCDGLTDEDLGVGGHCDGVGVCPAGELVCNLEPRAGEGDKLCSTTDPRLDTYAGSVEKCNALDDDCDGETDEAFDIGAGFPCNGEGACGDGVFECDCDTGDADDCDNNFDVRCSTDPGGTQYNSQPNGCDDDATVCGQVAEICDGLDNDCDGQTDEGLGLGEACEGVGDCGQGILECADDFSVRCSTDPNGSQFATQPNGCDSGGTVGTDCARASDESGHCDGMDNDCDGETDEDWIGLEGADLGDPCNGTGACTGQTVGEMVCTADGSDIICSASVTAEGSYEDACDGRDNDCDGVTDESDNGSGVEQFRIGDACTSSNGVCAEATGGVYECNGTGGWRCSTDPSGSATPAGQEVCDDIDNDCDGQTDETFNVGDGNPCDGKGECGVGIYECACDTTLPGDCDGNYDVRCSTDQGGTFYGGNTELCNGVDDDCDGETDEGFGVGYECEGRGQCGLGTYECDPDDAEKVICSTDNRGSEDGGQDEICDSLDNDCDGETDEDFPVGDACTADMVEGVCNRLGEIPPVGVKQCASDGGIICSTMPGGLEDNSTSELCDELDNDCDGETDETFPVGQTCQPFAGCDEGTVICTEDGLNTKCSAENDDIPEVCDGLDNNCNGLVDEDFTLQAGWCEGDEDCGPLGSSCEGVGECGYGVWECDDTGSTTRCSSVNYPDGRGMGSAYEPISERCDGLDNDCDGETDEDFNVGEACEGVGECGDGIWECANTTTAQCSTSYGGSEPEAVPELCDALDNDCDGETDEDFNLGETCQGVGECPDGEWICDPSDASKQRQICSTSPGGPDYPDPAPVETCDWKDNDCDGQTDENWITNDQGEPLLGAGWPEIRNPCNAGRCGWGEWICDESGESAYCTAWDESGDEVCNDIDDDCDGEIDEDFKFPQVPAGQPALGLGCDGVGECGQGVWECDENDPTGQSMICSSDIEGSQYDGITELCDNLDNDCDGETDEDFKNAEGAYDHPNHCGQCNNTCTCTQPGVPCDAVFDCASGSCSMINCMAGYLDLNGEDEDGCECELTDSGGEDCYGTKLIPNGGALTDADGGTRSQVEGQIAEIGLERFYRFHAVDTDDTVPPFCDEFNLEIRFLSNPGGKFEMDIYKNSCSDTPECQGTLDFSYDMNFTNGPPFPGVGAIPGGGECPCRSPNDEPVDEPSDGGNDVVWNYTYCSDQSATYYIKVRYKPEVSEPTCSSYVFEVTNAR